jgi:deazaflavin-dependent oxidoreductase (nitroreductase family)
MAACFGEIDGLAPAEYGARAAESVATLRYVQGFGSSHAGVWLIKHVVSPLDRWLYPITGGRVLSTGLRRGRVLLLTTTGRRSGRLHTMPVFYIADAERLVLCSVTPPFERASPWTLNLRAEPLARVQVGRTVGTYHAHEATSGEVDRYWPRLVGVWPAYEEHYARSRRRMLFVLEPTPNPPG